MEEKIILQGERRNVKRLFAAFVLIGLAVSIALFVFTIGTYIQKFERHTHSYYCYKQEYRAEYHLDKDIGFFPPYKMYCDYAYTFNLLYPLNHMKLSDILSALQPLILMTLLGACVYLPRRHCELFITNKRVYGIPKWNKKIAVPLDSVTSTATHGRHGITISTYTKNYTFLGIRNAAQIYRTLNHLLMDNRAEKNRT